MTTQRKVIGIGEVLWDMLPSGPRLGGAPANFAYHVGQLGLPAAVVSRVGHDSLGHQATRQLRGRGIEVMAGQCDLPTGTVDVQLDAAGVPAYHIATPAAWDCIEWTPALEEAASRAMAICWGTLAQRGHSAAAIRKAATSTPHDCLKIFDANLRAPHYSMDAIAESLQMCNVLKLNDDELALLASNGLAPTAGDEIEACRGILHCHSSLRMVVLTCGSRCSHVVTSGGEASTMPTPHVNVADTVGAGDSFTAAMCAALLSGMPAAEAHRLAVDVSAYVCTCHGAMPPMPAALKARLTAAK